MRLVVYSGPFSIDTFSWLLFYNSMSVYECMCVCVCMSVCVYLKFSQKRHKTFLSRISNFFESAFSLLYFFVFIFFGVFAKFRPRWVASHFCLLFLSASRGNSCQNLLFTLLPTVSIYQLVFASSLPSPVHCQLLPFSVSLLSRWTASAIDILLAAQF